MCEKKVGCASDGERWKREKVNLRVLVVRNLEGGDFLIGSLFVPGLH